MSLPHTRAGGKDGLIINPFPMREWFFYCLLVTKDFMPIRIFPIVAFGPTNMTVKIPKSYKSP